jgi:hypothetical protein
VTSGNRKMVDERLAAWQELVSKELPAANEALRNLGMAPL